MEAALLQHQTTPAPRATFPTHSRAVENTDRRTRELAAALNRLHGESMAGATEALLLQDFSAFELRTLRPAAERIARHRFVRQDAVLTPEPPSDEMLLAEATALFADFAARLATRLRTMPDMNEDILARIWPRAACAAAATLAKSPLPRPLAERATQ